MVCCVCFFSSISTDQRRTLALEIAVHLSHTYPHVHEPIIATTSQRSYKCREGKDREQRGSARDSLSICGEQQYSKLQNHVTPPDTDRRSRRPPSDPCGMRLRLENTGPEGGGQGTDLFICQTFSGSINLSGWRLESCWGSVIKFWLNSRIRIFCGNGAGLLLLSFLTLLLLCIIISFINKFLTHSL